jgi:hypothetical protein
MDSEVAELTMQNSLLLAVTNKGEAACYLFGYPGISLYDSQGTLLPLAYERTGDEEVTSASPHQVNLAAGATAYVMINESAAFNCDGSEVLLATTLQFIPPDTTTPLTIDLQEARNLYACPTTVSPSLAPLAISPVESTAGATYAPIPTT